MNRIFVAAAALSFALGAYTTQAAADPIIVTDVEVPLREIITLNTPVSVSAYVGQIVLTTTTGAIIPAWCIDLYHDVGVGGGQNLHYETGPIITDNSGNGGTGRSLSPLQLDEMAGLITYGDALLAGGGTAAESAAIQLAIWSVEYAGFSFSGASADALAEFNKLVTMASDLHGSAEELQALDGQQSFAHDPPPVPEPGSLLLLGTAVLGLGFFVCRRESNRPAPKRHSAA
ncbi:MAG TPA: PEP-CTERM sorting domain-containing protein [Stellaceae bacterium]|nr:PEP-CTERM sorting domain-containing protein [Stellaceae bacterium]